MSKKIQTQMFNHEEQAKRLGSLQKNPVLLPLEQVEIYLIEAIKEYKIECSYDVTAREMPYFKTLGYTEYGTNLILNPLNLELRSVQVREASQDTPEKIYDYAEYLQNNILKKQANKYQDREDFTDGYPPVKNIVVLPGSNRLKDRTCLNKLIYISKKHEGNVYFKPHPLTKHIMIGELKDLFGEYAILPREADLYAFLVDADKVYTTHISESALYASVLGKEIEPIDVYNNIQDGSFYHINRFLFELQLYNRDPKPWINKTFSSYKSGVINPTLDPD